MSLANQTVLVTGATGFLGGALARRLAADGAQVKALARNLDRTGYIRDVRGIEIVEGNITDFEATTRISEGCTTVFHVAAATNGFMQEQLDTNRDGTLNVAKGAAANGVRRFVHVSTISVYGYKQRGDVTEATPPDPGHDPYGITKRMAELAVMRVSDETGMDYTIVRPGMIYGPRSGMWTSFFYRVAQMRPTIWIGAGEGNCFPIHVDDVVDLLVTVARHDAASKQVFNCTPDPSPTWREFLGLYAHLAGHQRWLGIPPGILQPLLNFAGRSAPDNTPFKDLPDLLPFVQANLTYRMDKAHNLLDWQPQVELTDGIIGCVPWLREAGLLA